MVNVRAVKNDVQLRENVVQIILRLDKVIKISISSSAATLKVVTKGLLNEQKM